MVKLQLINLFVPFINDMVKLKLINLLVPFIDGIVKLRSSAMHVTGHGK